MTIHEIFLVLLIVVPSLLFIAGGALSRDSKSVWSPMVILSLIYLYYTVIGPVYDKTIGDTIYRTKDMQEFYWYSWIGASLSYWTIICSYYLSFRNGRVRDILQVVDKSLQSRFALGLFLSTFCMLFIISGSSLLSLINPLDQSFKIYKDGSGGAAKNYFLNSVNFLITVCVFIFIHVIRKRKHYVFFLMMLLLTLGIFVSFGFRWRIMILLGSLMISYFIITNRRPRWSLIGLLAISLVLFMGVIGMTRQYGSGLNTERLSNFDLGKVVTFGFKESKIFGTSGAVIELIPEDYGHIYFDPLVQTALFPIPRRFFPEKNSSFHQQGVQKEIFGYDHYRGAAFLFYAEAYAAFGWIGVIVSSLLIGIAMKFLWIKINLESNNPASVLLYSIAVCYLYVIFSRGYLPQIVNFFGFTVIPAFLLYKLGSYKLIKKTIR